MTHFSLLFENGEFRLDGFAELRFLEGGKGEKTSVRDSAASSERHFVWESTLLSMREVRTLIRNLSYGPPLCRWLESGVQEPHDHLLAERCFDRATILRTVV